MPMLSTRTFWPFSRPEGFDSFASTDVKSRRRDSDGSNNFCAAREDTPAAHLSFHHGTKPQCVSEIRSTNLRDSFSLIRQRPAAATFWKGCFWGYRIRAEIKKRINYWAFSHDFGSVPGSQININKIQSLLNIIDMDYRLEIPQFTLCTSQRGGVASSNAEITILRNTSRSDLAAFDGPEFTDRTPRTSRPIDVVICASAATTFSMP